MKYALKFFNFLNNTEINYITACQHKILCIITSGQLLNMLRTCHIYCYADKILTIVTSRTISHQHIFHFHYVIHNKRRYLMPKYFIVRRLVLFVASIYQHYKRTCMWENIQSCIKNRSLKLFSKYSSGNHAPITTQYLMNNQIIYFTRNKKLYFDSFVVKIIAIEVISMTQF